MLKTAEFKRFVAEMTNIITDCQKALNLRDLGRYSVFFLAL